MTKDREIPEFGDPETWGLTVGEYEEKYHSGLGDTWNIMRQLDDPELQKNLDETELTSLKNKSVRFNKEKKEFRDIRGKKYTFHEKHKINSEIRKEASKIIKDPNKLNRFMTAPDFETYQSGIPHIRKPMEPALNNVIKKTPEVKQIVTPGVTIDSAPVVTPRVVQEIPEPNFETPRDPDLDRGLGALLYKYKE